MTDLTTLYLHYNQISDISAVSGMTNLVWLSLSANQISNISTVSELTNLTSLLLYNNEIMDISAVAGLTNLTALLLSDNQISDISTLSGITNLTRLSLDNNQISDISALSGMTNLMYIHLHYNQISDISALSGLTNLQLRQLSLNYNPLDCPAYNIYIPMIETNNPGIGILYDPIPPECLVISVDVDIKPGSYPNSINLGSKGLIPVAILSNDEFDATTVNPETIELVGAGVAVRGKGSKYMAHEEDVNQDGLLDLVVQVETENLNPDSFQDGYAIVTGTTYDGQDIKGSDEIVIVPTKE